MPAGFHNHSVAKQPIESNAKTCFKKVDADRRAASNAPGGRVPPFVNFATFC